MPSKRAVSVYLSGIILIDILRQCYQRPLVACDDAWITPHDRWTLRRWQCACERNLSCTRADGRDTTVYAAYQVAISRGVWEIVSYGYDYGLDCPHLPVSVK